MESIEYRRFPIQLIALAIAALATVAIVLTMTGNLFDGNGSDNPVASSRAEPVARPANQSLSRDQSLFLEQNTNLPDSRPLQGGEVSINDMMEPTILLPGQSGTIGTDGDTRSIVKPTFISSEQMRFLEMNQLPGDSTLTPPYPDPARFGGPLTDY